MTDHALLELAFALYVVELIFDADEVRSKDEERLWQRWFPAATLVESGFRDPQGRPTAALDTYQARALRELPRVLDLDAKLELLYRFFRAGVADGSLHPSEMAVLAEGARFLSVPDAAFTQLMVRASLEHLGVDPDEPPSLL